MAIAIRSRRWAVALCALAVLAVLPFSPASAQSNSRTPSVVWQLPFEAIQSYDDVCGLQKIAKDVGTSVRPPVTSKRQTSSASISVSYGPGFSEEAQTAFQRAVDVWESHVSSSVEIRIQASFEDLEPGVLGSAGPSFVYGVDTDGDDVEDAVFGDALLDAVEDVDVACEFFDQCDRADIVARFNRSRTDWHFGATDAPPGRIDFTSVVVHEIGHGLNFIDQMSVAGAQGFYGIDFNQNGQLDPDERLPGIFDRFLTEETLTGPRFLTDTDVYPNPSNELGDALTSNNVFYRGPEAQQAAPIGGGPNPPRMFAPSSFQPGSSIAHVDESTYPAGSPNALMSPRINTNETARLPGPVVCGIFADIGWPLGPDCQRYFLAAFGLSANTTDLGGDVTLTWDTRPDASIDTYYIDQKTFDGDFEQIATLPGSSTPEIQLEDRGLGRFTYRLRWETDDGATGTAFEEPTVVFNVSNVEARTTSAPDGLGRADVSLTWTVPQGTQGFDYVVERRAGDTGDFVPVGTVLTPSFTADRQNPGTYGYRIRARDRNASANTLTSDTSSVSIPFEGDVTVIGPYPNPPNNLLRYDFTASRSQSVTIEVFNSIGQRVYRETRSVQSDTPTFLRIDVGAWASGMYVLRVAGERFQRTEKFALTN